MRDIPKSLQKPVTINRVINSKLLHSYTCIAAAFSVFKKRLNQQLSQHVP